MSGDFDRLRAERDALLVALRYISSPTMGLPANADAADFAVNGASEQAVRLALRVCINMARAAIAAKCEHGSTLPHIDKSFLADGEIRCPGPVAAASPTEPPTPEDGERP